MDEIALFTATGHPVAYIAPDEDNVIYLWSGEPVAYIEDEHVYGFNGNPLGWFEDDIIWDHSGRKVGFTHNTLPVVAAAEPFKGFKQPQPFKAFQQLAPFQPTKTAAIAQTPLDAFLRMGRL